MTFQNIRDYTKGVLKAIFPNRKTLYKFSESDTGKLLFNGKEISGGGGSGGVINAPLGTIISYMGNTPPDEYLACDGSVYNISTYQELADFINREFGSYNYFGGDGTSTFAVPDLRGEFLRGTGKNSHSKQGDGSAVGVHQSATFVPKINLNSTGNSIYFQNAMNQQYTVATNMDSEYDTALGVKNTGYFTNTNGTFSATGHTSHYTTRPTNTSVLYCIKYKTTETGEIYSLDEKVIGKWIDGKTVYRKVITGSLNSEQSRTIHTFTENIELINVCGNLIRPSDNNTLPVGFAAPGNIAFNVILNARNTLRILLGDTNVSLWNTSSYKIVIEYIKL